MTWGCSVADRTDGTVGTSSSCIQTIMTVLFVRSCGKGCVTGNPETKVNSLQRLAYSGGSKPDPSLSQPAALLSPGLESADEPFSALAGTKPGDLPCVNN